MFFVRLTFSLLVLIGGLTLTQLIRSHKLSILDNNMPIHLILAKIILGVVVIIFAAIALGFTATESVETVLVAVGMLLVILFKRLV